MLNWISNLSAYWLVQWCTYPRNETLVYKQAGKVVLNEKTNGLHVCSRIFRLLKQGGTLPN